MDGKEIQNLVDFFLEPDIDDAEFINEFIEKSGIDLERLNNNVFKLLKHAEAEAKLENGEKFKQIYLEAGKPASSKPQTESSASTLRLAARKQTDEFTENEADDVRSEEEKLKLIKKIKDDM